jgi:hypothetical protein
MYPLGGTDDAEFGAEAATGALSAREQRIELVDAQPVCASIWRDAR